MAVHTYVGARYVPNFVGTYDVTQNYEALDVVDNGSGTSYIARIPTPAGTPLTDREYWFLYGSSSGAIVALQNQVNALDADVQDLDKLTSWYVTPQMFGAVGDGVTDDSAAIQNAFNAAAGKCLIFPDGDYYVTSGITATILPKKLIMNGNIKYDGTGTCLTLGSATDYDNMSLDLEFKVYNVQHGGTGIKLSHVRSSSIKFAHVYNFEHGVVLGVTERAFIYNVIILEQFSSNDYSLDLIANGTSGWITNNMFIGGDLAKGSLNHADCTGIRMITNTNAPIEENVFYNTSAEDVQTCIYVDGARNNRFESFRSEQSTNVLVSSANKVNAGNIINISYGPTTQVNNSTNPQLPITHAIQKVEEFFTSIIKADIADYISDGANSSFANGLSFINNGSMDSTAPYGTITPRIYNSRPYGVRAKSNINKEFLFVLHSPDGVTVLPEVGFLMFDASDVKIIDPDKIEAIMLDNNAQHCTLEYLSYVQGGCVSTRYNTSQHIMFKVAADVKSVIVFPYSRGYDESNMTYDLRGIVNEGYITAGGIPVLANIATTRKNGCIYYTTSDAKVHISLPNGTDPALS